jgi:hypothetical protein
MTSFPMDSLAKLVPFANAATPEVRRAATERWLSAAQAEHASIASFSRFTLQLIAVGAPAELLTASHHAGLDEIEHTRMCFSIASIYAGVALGPGPLPLLAHGDVGYDLASVVRGTIEEGCVGETIAALEAECSRDLAGHEVLRSVLDRIHRDETTHARLAFQTVAWGLVLEPALREMARDAFECTINQHRRAAVPESAPDAELTPHGLLSCASRRRIRDRAIDEVLAPAIEQLFA